MSEHGGSGEQRSAVVTGASTGIGYATCKVLIEEGWCVFGGVRKAADAERLQNDFGSEFEPLDLDVTDREGVVHCAQVVNDRLDGRKLTGLVNNAGVAVFGALAHLPIEEFEHQIAVNLTGVLTVTQAFLRQLGLNRVLEGPPGRIVQISSMAGKIGAPFLGPYVASKHGMEGLSESLRRELLLYGIDVVIIGPGAVKTPIWDKAEEVEDFAGKGTEFEGPVRRLERRMLTDGRRGLEPEAIGRLVHHVLTTSSPKTRYAVTQQKLQNWVLPTRLPKRMVDRIFGKRLKLL